MNSELPKTKIDERTGIEYHLEGDYYIPNLTIPKQENTNDIIPITIDTTLNTLCFAKKPPYMYICNILL